MSQRILMAAIVLFVALIAGCREPVSTPRAIPEHRQVLQAFTLEMTDSSGKTIGRGTISLPPDISEGTRFTGSCKISVSDVSSEPSSQQDYALRCLSENNGTLSGTTKVGGIRIALHPLIDDHTVYLEGRITAGTFKGKWYYQSYAGYDEFGSFDAKAVKENIP